MLVQDAQDETRAIFDRRVVESARGLSRLTPQPRQVRVTGVLDMLRASTQTFAIELQNGETVRGTFLHGEIETLKDLFKQNVTVLGKAVFRPSGHLLRIDADELFPAEQQDSFFSRIPAPIPRKLESAQQYKGVQQTQGIAAIFGKWPGNETDDEISEALNEIS